MDSSTRYSAGSVVPDTSMESAISVLDSHWISPFWAPNAIQFDKAFSNHEFQEFLSLHGINPRSIPARRHNKNVLDSKHKMIREILLRIISGNESVSEIIAAQQAIRISNDLYGNNICSSHELAKGFTRPIECGNLSKIIPPDLIRAREVLKAKRKLNLILKSKSTEEIPVKVGDIVQVYIKLQNEKRGKWSSPKPVLCYDHKSRTVTVPGQNGRKINAALEDVRNAISENELATKYQEPIDALDLDISKNIDILTDENISENASDDDEIDNDTIGPTYPRELSIGI